MTNYKPRLFKISIREEYKGRCQSRDFSSIQGKVVLLRHAGYQGEDESYPNEEMLMPDFKDEKTSNIFEENDLTWLASGDLDEIVE